jgi:hypothetical protein
MFMKKIILTFVLFSMGFTSNADTLFSQGFEERAVIQQFPKVNGVFQLPDYAVSQQLDWLMQQFSLSDTSINDINTHFDLASFGITAQVMRDFIQTLRNQFPNAEITDVIMVTPVRLTLLIANPNDTSVYGFLNLGAHYTGTKRINFFSVSNYFGSVQFPVDMNLSMNQAFDKFQTLSTQSSVLLAQIDGNGVCQPLFERNSTQLRATASIFKIFVLTAAANAWMDGDIQLEQLITLVSSELALGGAINLEPLGTQFSLLEIATLMLGISDNTATDLLHETIGRDFINQSINSLGLSQPQALTPLLGISEQFHLFFSFSLSTALSYVNGSEAFQADFITNQIEPLGALTTFPFNNESLFIGGSWQASPMDICQTFAYLRDLPEGSDALFLADTALGAGVAQPEVRNFWDRVWYKGGSLESSANGLLVLTHAWMLERQGENPYVIIGMANNPTGNIDVFNVQSVLGRILELTRGL